MSVKKYIIIFLACLAGVCFGVAVSTHLLVSGALSKTYRAYIVQSGSMAPALPVGSVVITKSEQAYGKGDIVTFSHDRKTQTTHRINAVEFEGSEPVFTTKGDANEEPDGAKIKSGQILGKSLFVIPFVGYLADFVRTPKGFVIFVVIPASIIVYEELKTIIKTLKQSFSRKRESSDSSGSPTESGMTKSSLLIPVLGVFFLFLGATGSFFLDNEASSTNVLGAAASFGTPTGEPTPTPTPTPDPKINEFLAHPAVQVNEWVEIYNNGSSPINFAGWALKDTVQLEKDISSLGVLAPGAFAVFEDGPDGWLNNATETIQLLDPADTVIDQDTYSGTTEGVTRGRATDGTGAFQTCLAL